MFESKQVEHKATIKKVGIELIGVVKVVTFVLPSGQESVSVRLVIPSRQPGNYLA
jgi:hypothetical protein